MMLYFLLLLWIIIVGFWLHVAAELLLSHAAIDLLLLMWRIILARILLYAANKLLLRLLSIRLLLHSKIAPQFSSPYVSWLLLVPFMLAALLQVAHRRAVVVASSVSAVVAVQSTEGLSCLLLQLRFWPLLVESIHLLS